MHSSSRSIAWTLIVAGLIVMVAGWGGQWGVAYGQTAGPTPTPGDDISGLSGTKRVDQPSPQLGETFTFSIQVQNNEATSQPDVMVKDTILDFLEIVTVTSTKGTVTVDGQNITVDVGTLDPGEIVTVTIAVRVRSTATTSDTGINVAQVMINGTTQEIMNTNPVAVAVAGAGGSDGGSDGGVGHGPPRGLPETGASEGPNLPLLAAGLVLLLAGSGLLFRSRRRPSLT